MYNVLISNNSSIGSNANRNLWIMFLFMAGFFAIHLIASQVILASKPRGEILLYNPKNYSQQNASKGGDEEATLHATTEEQGEKAKGLHQMPGRYQSSQGTIHWSNLSYQITAGKTERKLLTDVNGWIRPGKLTALMGATGAGKTTLMDVLSQRTTAGDITGEIYFNGKPRGTDFMRKTGYVQQQDVHCSTSTVRESLQFSAMMRQPPHVPMPEKLEYAEEIIKLLELETISDAMVGDPGQGLNVEQRKRLSIGVELAAKPEILILDEPTSGLDSQTAWNICSLLQKLADHGHAVVCTIHQPSSGIFSMFDELLLIASEGKTLYFGEIGSDAQAVLSYFEKTGARPCRVDENPAEWLFEITTQAAATHFAELWNSSAELSAVRNYLTYLSAETVATITSQSPGKTDPAPPSSVTDHSQFATPFFFQFKVLFIRSMTDYWRTPAYLWAKLAFCCGAALIISVSCSNASRSLQGLQTLLFAIFLLFTNFSNLMQQILPVFAARRILFEARERQSRTYSWSAFLLSNIVAEAMWQTIGSVLAFALFYFPIGMYSSHEHQNAGMMWLFMWLFFLFTSTMSTLLIAAIDQVDTAVNIGQLVFYLILMFCGVLVPKSALPRFWIFMYRISPLTYLVSGMIAVGVGNGPILCSETELLRLTPPFNVTCGRYLESYIDFAGGALVNRDATDMCEYCPLSTVSEFLDRFSISYEDRWFQFGIVWVFIAFNVACTFAVYWMFRVPKGQRLGVSESGRGNVVENGHAKMGSDESGNRARPAGGL
jgi:ATP-binding cassette subfamily G (WHITE) protein 2 (PDR)